MLHKLSLKMENKRILKSNLGTPNIAQKLGHDNQHRLQGPYVQNDFMCNPGPKVVVVAPMIN